MYSGVYFRLICACPFVQRWQEIPNKDFLWVHPVLRDKQPPAYLIDQINPHKGRNYFVNNKNDMFQAFITNSRKERIRDLNFHHPLDIDIANLAIGSFHFRT